MRVCAIAHTYFPRDPRVRKEARAMAEAGHDVQVVCLRQSGEAATERWGEILVHRLPVTRGRHRGKAGYMMEYLRFFALASAKATRLDLKGRFDVVHVHNIPDALVFAALLPKLRGAGVVLDMHDPMPELFAAKYGLSGDSSAKSLLTRLELASCEFADHLLVPTEPCRARLLDLGVPDEKVTVVMNLPEEDTPAERHDDDAPFVVVYHGSVFGRYGLDDVLRALALAETAAPDIELHIYASDVEPQCLHRLSELTQELDIADRVAFSGYMAPLAMRAILSSADAGIVPARRSPHMDLAYPTKLFEYLARGLPVLAARTPAVEDLLPEGSVDFYDPQDPVDLALALIRLREQPADKRPAARFRLMQRMCWPEMAERCTSALEKAAAHAGSGAGRPLRHA